MNSGVRVFAAGVAALSLSLAAAGGADAKKLNIKAGTLAPKESVWFNALTRMSQRWRDATGGEVLIKIYPGGVAGDEGDMVRKIRTGQLQMAMVTGIGLSQINRASLALAIPMMFDSYEELDYVRDRIGPKLAVEMEKAGFVVLNWGDAGWIHHFSTVPAKTPDEYRKLKYFVWSEDPASEDAWREARFQPIPLSATDVVASLRTDMIQAFGTSPVYALSSQWFNQAPYMVKVNWCPLNGATVLGKDHWDKIDPALRPKLLEIAREEGLALRAEVRSLHDKAVTAMVQRGLTAYDSDPGLTKQWREAAEIAYGVIRSKVVPAEYFDEVKKLSEEFRSKKK